jgi:hypothetical protein
MERLQLQRVGTLWMANMLCNFPFFLFVGLWCMYPVHFYVNLYQFWVFSNGFVIFDFCAGFGYFPRGPQKLCNIMTFVPDLGLFQWLCIISNFTCIYFYFVIAENTNEGGLSGDLSVGWWLAIKSGLHTCGWTFLRSVRW